MPEPKEVKERPINRESIRYAKNGGLSIADYINQGIILATEQTIDRVSKGESAQLYAKLTPIIEIIQDAVRAIEELETLQS